MGDNVEFWIVGPDDETILRIDEARRCPVDRVELDDEGVCRECGLNWTVFS